MIYFELSEIKISS